MRKVYSACKADPLASRYQNTKIDLCLIIYFLQKLKEEPEHALPRLQAHARDSSELLKNHFGYLIRISFVDRRSKEQRVSQPFLQFLYFIFKVKVQTFMDSFHVTGQSIVIVKFPNRNWLISTPRLNILLCVHLVPIT